jgi:putative endonuclease
MLQSIDWPKHFYAGLTEDLKSRVAAHNRGEAKHTMKFRPWKMLTSVAFENKEKAAAFERYLKSGSGRAFAKKHSP